MIKIFFKKKLNFLISQNQTFWFKLKKPLPLFIFQGHTVPLTFKLMNTGTEVMPPLTIYRK